jgi:hypothetical protein
VVLRGRTGGNQISALFNFYAGVGSASEEALRFTVVEEKSLIGGLLCMHGPRLIVHLTFTKSARCCFVKARRGGTFVRGLFSGRLN